MEEKHANEEPSSYRQRMRIVLDSTCETECRVFAALELILGPVSLITVFLLLPLQIILSRCGVQIPSWCVYAMQILLSAAIGYLTNFIALEMLFKPFDRDSWHWLRICSFGYWRQGLVPKNKDVISEKIGEQVEKKLLPPPLLADKIVQAVTEVLENPETMTNLRTVLTQEVSENPARVTRWLSPVLQKATHGLLERFLQPEAFARFLSENILPAVNTVENRRTAAEKILNKAVQYTPQVTELLKGEIARVAQEYVSEKSSSNFLFGMLSGMAEGLVEKVINGINWAGVEQRLKEKLLSDETHQFLNDRLKEFVAENADFSSTEEGRALLQKMLPAMRSALQEKLDSEMQAALPGVLKSTLADPQVWNVLEAEVLPAIKEWSGKFLREKGGDFLQRKIKIREMVEQAIHRQDVRQFYGMITSVSAQHLGAIQVLGYVLGGIIGLLQCFG